MAENDKSSDKKKLLILLFIVSAAAAFAVYYGALSNGFIWDDPIVLQSQLSAFRSIKDIFFPPPGIPQFGIHYYRPIIVLTLLIDKKLGGSTPFGFHLSVILFHVINTLLVYFLARIVLRRFQYSDVGAFVASLIFAVHPIHTESVSWMAGRSDVVAAIFFFASMILYIKYAMRTRSRWLDGSTGLQFLIPSTIAFFLAACSKEASISLIFLLPVIDISFSRVERERVTLTREEERKRKKEEKKKKRSEGGIEGDKKESKVSPILEWLGRLNLAGYIPFIIATIIYLMLRYAALKGQGANVPKYKALIDVPRYLINSYGFYLEKLFFPVNLKAYIPEIPGGALYTLLSAAVLIALIVLAVWSLLKRSEIFFFMIMFFLLTVLPSLSVALMMISETPLAERYLYIPSFSLSLLAGFALLYVPSRLAASKGSRMLATGIITVLLVGVISVYAFQTVERIPAWKDDILFWEDIVRKLPNEGLPHLNLGLAYNEKDRIDDAEREYVKAINSNYDDEGRSTAYNNLGNVYLGRSEFDRAEEAFRTSMSIRPTYATPYYSMALSLWRRFYEAGQRKQNPDPKLVKDAIQYLDKAIQLNPQYVKAHLLLGNIYIAFKKYDQARQHLQTVLRYEQQGNLAETARKLLNKISDK